MELFHFSCSTVTQPGVGYSEQINPAIMLLSCGTHATKMQDLAGRTIVESIGPHRKAGPMQHRGKTRGPAGSDPEPPQLRRAWPSKMPMSCDLTRVALAQA